MNELVAVGSTIDDMIITLETRLVDNPNDTDYDGLSEPIAANPLAMVQWTQQTLLGSRLDFWLTGERTVQQPSFTDIKSMKDLGMNFNVPPEFIKAGVITVEQGLAMSWNGAYQQATKSLIDPIIKDLPANPDCGTLDTLPNVTFTIVYFIKKREGMIMFNSK